MSLSHSNSSPKTEIINKDLLKCIIYDPILIFHPKFVITGNYWYITLTVPLESPGTHAKLVFSGRTLPFCFIIMTILAQWLITASIFDASVIEKMHLLYLTIIKLIQIPSVFHREMLQTSFELVTLRITRRTITNATVFIIDYSLEQ